MHIRRQGGGQGRPFGYGSGALGLSSSCWSKGELAKDMYDILGRGMTSGASRCSSVPRW